MLHEYSWWESSINTKCDVEYIRVMLSTSHVAVTFGGIKSFIYPILLSRSVVFHYIFDPWHQPGPWEKETLITQSLPCFVICSNSYTRIWHTCSPLYASMTFQVTERVWYNISRNPTTTTCSVKVSTTRDFTHKLCMYNPPTSFNRRPVSLAAIVIASHWAPCLYILVLLIIHAPVKDCYWSKHRTSLISSRWSLPGYPAS